MSVQTPTSNAPMLADRTNYIDANAAKWEEALPQLDGVTADIATGEVVLTVRDSGARAARTNALAEAIDVPFRVESSGTGTTRDNRGGLNMTTCTTGFGASSGTSQGVVTAAHCGTQSWFAAGSSTANSTYQHTVRFDAYADIQTRRLATGVTAQPDIWTGSSYQKVTGTATSVVGLNLCHRGAVTGLTCGNLTSTTYKPVATCNVTSCASVWVTATAARAGGDSGGPWFGNGKAYGVHHGGNTTSSIYSKIQYLNGGWAIKIG